jgi:hypothetical protein
MVMMVVVVAAVIMMIVTPAVLTSDAAEPPPAHLVLYARPAPRQTSAPIRRDPSDPIRSDLSVCLFVCLLCVSPRFQHRHHLLAAPTTLAPTSPSGPTRRPFRSRPRPELKSRSRD